MSIVTLPLLERGAGARAFELRGEAETFARGLVAREDGLGLQVVLGHPEIDGAAAERILLAWASAASIVHPSRLGPSYGGASG